eukprot:365817-Chlamydomonas_euryale.AAC.24
MSRGVSSRPVWRSCSQSIADGSAGVIKRQGLHPAWQNGHGSASVTRQLHPAWPNSPGSAPVARLMRPT